MKSAVFLWFTVAFCLASLAWALPPPWKDVVRIPMRWLAMSKGGRHPGYGAPSQAIPPQLRRRPLRHCRKTTEDVAARVKLISALLQTVKDDITAFRKSLRVPSPADGGSRVNASSEGPSLGEVSNDIDRAFEEILKRVHEAFPAPDEAAHHAARQHLISHILEGAEIELIKILCAKHNLVGEDALRTFWRGVSPIIASAVVTTGDLAEQHPKLAAFVIAGVIAMLIPESWFTKPLLRLIGFSPVGPAKVLCHAAPCAPSPSSAFHCFSPLLSVLTVLHPLGREELKEGNYLETWPSRLPTPSPPSGSPEPPSPFPRYVHSVSSSTVSHGALDLFGGLVDGRASRNDVYLLRAAFADSNGGKGSNETGSLSISASLFETGGAAPSPRVNRPGAIVSSVLVIWGGQTNSGIKVTINTTSVFSTNIIPRNAGRWATVHGLAPGARYGHAAASIGASFFVFGGQASGCSSTIFGCSTFSPNTLCALRPVSSIGAYGDQPSVQPAGVLGKGWFAEHRRSLATSVLVRVLISGLSTGERWGVVVDPGWNGDTGLRWHTGVGSTYLSVLTSTLYTLPSPQWEK
ncbi:hypothetical protein PLEOSDRAFT_1085441 [Pleurotus ostreatus PC15]|uniref:Uncharacterized protein n=1 Tax=Pleurotus ostreatus (strain PC15) TaxID=1137138 RepID=A0A067NRH5_PLEO1|nr:hypothetical protein PLEOSDRAFT_1085441 [Pleurotus ostreatus PC15]